MMNVDDVEQNQQLQKMAQMIADAVSPIQVYLIGSYARGTVHPGSDIDFIVIMSDEALQRQTVLDCWRQARYALRNVNIPIDILIYPDSVWNQWRNSPHHILGTCQEEGKLLYAA